MSMDNSKMERLDMTKIQIAVAYHKDSKLIKNDCLLPIQVGKACSDIELDMQGDDTGDNISSKNFGYAELTAIYWLWKNSKADIKGLFHYRRFLDLNLKSEHYNEDIYEYLLSEHFSSPNFLEKMEISQNNINELLKKIYNFNAPKRRFTFLVKLFCTRTLCGRASWRAF